MEDWYKRGVIYELSVKSFCDSNGDGVGDFEGLRSRLDYLRDLGVDCLWLLPIMPSPWRDDGYDVENYYDVHPAYGSLEDFRRLVEDAHCLGLRILIDLVLNHTSDRHPWFLQARQGPGNPYHDYYVWSPSPDRYRGVRVIFCDYEPSNWTWDPTCGLYYWHRFYHHQPDLNYDNPVVQEEMLRVARFWLDLGVDGFRVDAVPYLFEREGTLCENLPETHAYIRRLRALIDDYPGRILLAEANQWPEQLRQYFGQDDEFHMAFHFPLMPRVFLALAQGQVHPLRDILERTPQPPPSGQWALFLRNHDELTLEMVSEEERELLWRYYAPEPRQRFNLGIRRRLAPLLDHDPRRLRLVHALLLTLPGTPVLYYGDEIGLGDNPDAEDRHGQRAAMPWHEGPGLGFSSASPERWAVPRARDPEGRPPTTVEGQRRDPGSLWRFVHRFLSLRREVDLFGTATVEYLQGLPASVLGFFRRQGKRCLLAVFHFAEGECSFTVDLRSWEGLRPRDFWTGEPLAPVGSAPYRLDLGPFGWRLLWLTEGGAGVGEAPGGVGKAQARG